MTSHPEFVGEEASVAQDLRARSPAPVRRVVALTRDAALSRALEELAGGGLDICVVADAESFSEELLQNNSSTALVDAAASPAPVEGFVDALATQFPELRLLVAGHSAEQNVLATRIASGRVLRFVHKPASPQRLKLMIDASSRQADPHRITVTQTLEVLQEPRPAAHRTLPDLTLPGRSRLPLFGAAAVAVVALLAWALWPDDSAPRPQASAPATAASPAATDPSSASAELVRRADQAFAAGRYVAADGSSAAELYRDALKLSAGDARARSGFERSIDFGLQGAERSLVAERIDEAAGAAETLRLLVPGNSRLAFLQSQIDKERTRVNADATQRAAFEARQQQIARSLAQMSADLGRGALIEPARDNAVAHFRAAESLGAGDPAVRAARDTLVAALLKSADAELQAQRVDGAGALIQAAATINSGAAGLDPLRRRLEQQSAAPAAASAAPASAPAANAPATTAALSAPQPAAASAPAVAPAIAPSAAPAAVEEAVSASALRRTTYVAPTYPPRALDQLLSGWVDLEFTVNAQGRVQDIVVIDAEPGTVFNSAAIAAARRWRYDPVVRNGEPAEVRARQRVRFTAKDQGASR